VADESIRSLERALAAEPSSGVARVQLARALVRAGRGREALARLDLATIDEGSFTAARALADDLWRDELSGLVRAAVIPAGRGPHHGESAVVVTPSGLVGWYSDWAMGGGFAVADLATARVIHSEPRHRSLRQIATRDRVFSDEAPIEGGARIVSVDRSGAHVVDLPPGGRFYDVDPAGERVLVLHDDALRIHEWPSFRVLHERPRAGALIDWEESVLLVNDAKDERWFVPLGGGEPAPIPSERADYLFHRLARGVFAATGRGLRLYTWPGRHVIKLLPAAPESVPQPSLAADRRIVRIVLGGKPRRFEVDLERGEVVSTPPNVEKLARSNAETGHWHPHTDAVWRYRKDRLEELATPEHRRVLILPAGVWPRAWSPDGHTLVCVSTLDSGERNVEIWRSST
jgi:hypothetical protein